MKKTAVLAPVVLTMPSLPLVWPSVCGAAICNHVMCHRWRENVKTRCAKCDQLIAGGQRFTEHRDPITKDLISQEHEVCPVRSA